MEKITIGNKEYYITEPTFVALDSIKKETGFDISLGLKDEAMKQLTSDFSKLSRVIAIIAKDNEDEEFNVAAVDKRQKLFYQSGKLSDFVKAMNFFSKVLSGSVQNSQQQGSEKTTAGKAKMKLLKKN